MYDGNPGYPDLSTLWRLAERHRVSYFGVSAPYIHACLKAGLRPTDELDLSGIRALGSTGAPLSVDGFRWVADAVGKHVQICSMSGGTDVCTAFLESAPTVPVWLGELSCAALGASVAAYDVRGAEVVDEVGELVLTKPMPSMPVSFWNDPDGSRLRAAYFADFPRRLAARRLGPQDPARVVRHLRAQRLDPQPWGSADGDSRLLRRGRRARRDRRLPGGRHHRTGRCRRGRAAVLRGTRPWCHAGRG